MGNTGSLLTPSTGYKVPGAQEGAAPQKHEPDQERQDRKDRDKRMAATADGQAAQPGHARRPVRGGARAGAWALEGMDRCRAPSRSRGQRRAQAGCLGAGSHGDRSGMNLPADRTDGRARLQRLLHGGGQLRPTGRRGRRRNRRRERAGRCARSCERAGCCNGSGERGRRSSRSGTWKCHAQRAAGTDAHSGSRRTTATV